MTELHLDTAIQLKTIAPHFQRSINLTYDAGNADYIAGYIPTPNATQALAGMLECVSTGKTQRSYVLHAPYGSGKSLLGLVVSAFVDPDENTIPALRIVQNRLTQYFPEQAKIIGNFQADNRKLLPVLLSGDEGDLSIALIRALTRTLLQCGLGDLRPRTQFQAALTIIELWEKTYPAVFRQLLERLAQEQVSLVDLLNGLNTLQLDYLTLFEKLYPDLTAGAKFDIYAGQTLMDAFHHTAVTLKEQGYDGIFIIWDEFGRFIEAKAGEAFGPEAALLQSFAEFCNRSGENQVHFVLITHRLLTGYTAQLPLVYQQEWARIAERFRSYDIASDPAVTYRLISGALNISNENAWFDYVDHHRHYFNKLIASTLELNLFPGMDDITARQIVEATWPLHPLTVYALPRLAGKVAQNERTLFTFLAADEPGTLTEHLSKSNEKQIGLGILWDYFSVAIRADVGPGGSHNVWSGVIHALSKVSADDQIAISLIKTIGVLLIVGDVNTQQHLTSGRIVPTTKLLAWVLDVVEEEIASRLDALAQRRVMVYRRSDGYWSFTRGSDIDLESEIATAIERRNPTLLQMRKLLEQELPLPFLIPRGYNLEHQMTRFLWGLYRWPQDLQTSVTEDFLKQLGPQGYADGVVIYVLVKDQADRAEALAILKQLSTPQTKRVIYVIPDRPLHIFEPLRELFALRDLNNDPNFMLKDERLERELEFFVEDTLYRLNRALHPLLVPSDNSCTWHWLEGDIWRQQRLHTEADVSILLSALCEHWFDKTPLFNNELLNQQSPSTQQINALNKVIDALLKTPDEPLPVDLGLPGNGPDYLIFKTILVASGLLQVINNTQKLWQVARPKNNERMAVVWDVGQEFLQTTEGEAREAAILLDKLLSPPYGIRRGVLPVLLAIILRPRLGVLTIRHNRKVVPAVTGQVLIDLCRHPEQYTIEVGPWDEFRKILWEVLQQQFHSFVGIQEEIRQPLSYLSLALLRWLQTQPRFCRDTNRLSPEAHQLRNLIRKAQNNPAQVLLYDLQDLLGNGISSATSLEDYRQLITTRLTRWLSEISSAYQTILYELDSFAESEFAADTPVRQTHGQAAFAYWVATLERRVGQPLETFRFSDVLAQRFVEAVKQTTDAGRFWEQLSYAIMGIYPHDWNDRSVQTFKQNLLLAKERLEHELFDLAEDEAVVELTINLPDSDLPQHYRFRPSDLSKHGQRILQNFISTLEIAGRPLSLDERRQVALAFLHHVLEGNKPDVRERNHR